MYMFWHLTFAGLTYFEKDYLKKVIERSKGGNYVNAKIVHDCHIDIHEHAKQMFVGLSLLYHNTEKRSHSVIQTPCLIRRLKKSLKSNYSDAQCAYSLQSSGSLPYSSTLFEKLQN